jgi:hypothetical protein
VVVLHHHVNTTLALSVAKFYLELSAFSKT